MERKDLIESGKATNVLVKTWKKNADEYITDFVKRRKYQSIDFSRCKGFISPSILDFSLDKSLYNVQSINYMPDTQSFMVVDANSNYFYSVNIWGEMTDLSIDDYLKILKLIKAIEKANDAAKDY